MTLHCPLVSQACAARLHDRGVRVAIAPVSHIAPVPPPPPALPPDLVELPPDGPLPDSPVDDPHESGDRDIDEPTESTGRPRPMQRHG